MWVENSKLDVILCNFMCVNYEVKIFVIVYIKKLIGWGNLRYCLLLWEVKFEEWIVFLILSFSLCNV